MTSLSNGFVCIMGISTVFIGLICIVLICNLLSMALKLFAKSQDKPAAVKPAPAVTKSETKISAKEKSAIIAGVCACVAEELGEEASNIKVTSFKKI
jgi:hypothetical protein